MNGSDVFSKGTFVGRIWREDVSGPALVTIREGHVIDITCKEAPTMRDLMEMENPVEWVKAANGDDLGSLDAYLASGKPLLAPCDLQAVKACGVTFARSMIERVIEEKAAGNPALAEKVSKT